jgi:N-acetylneuraminic acid mutarotase
MIKKISFFLVLILFSIRCFSVNAQNLESTGSFSFTTSIPDIPVQKGIAGAFVGIDNNTLLVAGGSYFNRPLWEGGEKIYTDSIFACVKDGENFLWKFAGRLPFPVAHGAAVSTGNGLLCIGGENDHQIFGKVFIIQWDPAQQTVVIHDEYPPLPKACSYLSATLLNKTVYVVGGKMLDHGT